MKNRPKDEEYCGVDSIRIAVATPEVNWVNMAHFMEFVIERYRIHKKKDVKGSPSPWTNNEILRDFKFTNVRREHDRQSRYLIENISTNPKLSLEDKIVNTFMFRAWNNWSTLCLFGFPYSAKAIYDPGLKEKVRQVYTELNELEPERRWWSNAYNQGGTKMSWKFPEGDGYKRAHSEKVARKYIDFEPDIPLRPFHIGPWLKRQDTVNKLLHAENQEDCFKIIKSVRGFADFLAYQIFVDLTYIEDFPFSENEFVVAGPGCKKGIDYLFIDRDGMSYEECIFWLRDNINMFEEDCVSLFRNEDIEEHTTYKYMPNSLFNDLPKEDRRMNVMSIENCMCELSKYIRAVEGTGRPRNRYKGGCCDE
jgi:hypothetical protein